MRPILFIQNGCNACDEMVAFIHDKNISCEVKDIEKNAPPVSKNFGIVLPALFKDGQLLAYGPDDISEELEMLLEMNK